MKRKVLKSFKLRFAENLGAWMVTTKDGKVLVHAIDATVEVTPKENENVQELRNRVFNLVKGTPCNSRDVTGLLELALV